jgi:hypothetical protein
MDASGMRCLLRCHPAAEQAGTRLVLRHLSPWLLHALEVVGLVGRLHISPDCPADACR